MHNKIINLIKLAFVSKTNKDDGDFPENQIKYMGKVADCTVIYPYGMGGQVPKGGLMVVFNIQGQEENQAGIPTLPEQRIKDMKDTETWFGNPVAKSYIHFKADGSVELNVTGATLTINAAETIFNGNVKVKGDLIDKFESNATNMAGFRAAYNAHKHIGNAVGSLTDGTDTPTT